MMTAATNGAEDDAIKTFFDIFEAQRAGQRKLISDLEHMWSGYFKNLASMGMKHAMDQMIAPLLNPITKNQQNAGQPQSGTSTSSSSSIWGKIFGVAAPKSPGSPGGPGSGDVLSRAGTMLQTSATALQKSAAALQSAAQTLSSSSGGGGMGGGLSAGGADQGGGTPWMSMLPGLDTFSGYFAGGGDVTPGSSFVSGEAGAERVDLGRAGGARVTPLEAKAGGTNIYNNDFRGVVMTDDLMRRAEGMAAIRLSEGRMMSALPAMQREIQLRKRS
jgi:hypothetical protein